MLYFFTGSSTPSPLINFGVDEADCTITQSHFREFATGMAHLKTFLFGLSLQTHHRTTVVLALSKPVYPLMKKWWKRNVKADTIQDTYQVCEASFGFSPTSFSCSALHGSHSSDTACSQLCHPQHILTEASNIFRNWVLTCISMDLPLPAILASSWIKGEIFLRCI